MHEVCEANLERKEEEENERSGVGQVKKEKGRENKEVEERKRKQEKRVVSSPSLCSVFFNVSLLPAS